MKKICLALAAMIIALGVFPRTVFAASATEAYVTIADKNGDIVLAYQKTTITDSDGDSVITINDALICAHENYCEVGVSGYGTETGDYGLYINCLWGTKNGTGFGYYHNNESAWSLMDTVENGDSIYAFIYTDTDNFSDTYSFFNVNSVHTTAYEPFELTLSKLTYDLNTWSYVSAPAVGAVIEIDGVATQYVTDENGKVTVTIPERGSHVISAASDNEVLVPAVCITQTQKGDFLSALTFYFYRVVDSIAEFISRIIGIFRAV